MLRALYDYFFPENDEQTTPDSPALINNEQPLDCPLREVPLSSLRRSHVKLGEGGEATVEAGNWEDNGTVRPVAIKTFESLVGYKTELNIHQHLSKSRPHPHVIQAYGYTSPATAIIVTELLTITTLGDWFNHNDRNSQKRIKKAYDLMLNIVQGLIHLHALGVLHLDLKPLNILLTGRGTAKIIDFGCAELLPEGKDEVKLNEVKGTRRYMSPEVANSSLMVSRQSDVYTAGALILLCASIRGSNIYPHLEGNSADLMERIAKHKLPDIPSSIAGNTRKLILHCFEFNKEKRPSAQEVYDRLLKIAYP